MNSTLEFPKRRFPSSRMTPEYLMARTDDQPQLPDDHDEDDRHLRRMEEEDEGPAMEGDRFDMAS